MPFGPTIAAAGKLRLLASRIRMNRRGDPFQVGCAADDQFRLAGGFFFGLRSDAAAATAYGLGLGARGRLRAVVVVVPAAHVRTTPTPTPTPVAAAPRPTAAAAISPDFRE